MSRMHPRKRGQSLVIIALSATALFGIIALGLDAGRLYFERRDVQNAADAAALAGAQELLPKTQTTIVTSGMAASARYYAATYAFKTWNDSPVDGSGSGNYTVNSGTPMTERAQSVPAYAITTTASRGRQNEIKVEVHYQMPLTFAAMIGFSSSDVAAVAYAHGGFYNKQYTIFGMDAPGSGNSINYDQNGWGQIDDGANGTDCGNPDPALGKIVSNAKFHAPNPNQPFLDLNGSFTYAQASDTHAIIVYWQYPVAPAPTPNDPAPNYEAPAPPTLPVNPGVGNGTLTGAYGTRPVHYYSPGLYTNNVTINGNDYYIFANGIYYFQGANLTITGGYVSNTANGGPLPVGSRSNLPAASDGTNGVEFVFDGNAAFSASGTPHIFFIAPSVVPSPATDSIVFFITATDTITGPQGIPWSEQVDPGGSFEVLGTVYNADMNGTQGTHVVLQAVSTSIYAVYGSVISPKIDLDGGAVAPGASYTASTCLPSSNYRQNPAGLLVQFNPNYTPHFRGYSYLVK